MAISRSIAKLQLKSVLKSVAHVATKANTEVWDVGQKLVAWLESGGHAIQIWWPVLPPGATVSSGNRILLRAMSESMAYDSHNLDGHMWLLLLPSAMKMALVISA